MISVGAKIFVFLKLFITCFFKKQKPVGTVKTLLAGFVKILSGKACGSNHFWYIWDNVFKNEPSRIL